jgi:hypothetical protein
MVMQQAGKDGFRTHPERGGRRITGYRLIAM